MACSVATIVPFSVITACNCADVRHPGFCTAAVSRPGRNSRPRAQPLGVGREPSHMTLQRAVYNLSLWGGQAGYVADAV